jgi:hypothetical protein
MASGAGEHMQRLVLLARPVVDKKRAQVFGIVEQDEPVGRGSP